MNISIRAYGHLLAQYLRPQRTRVLLLALFLVTSVVLQLVNPQIIRAFIDAAQAGAAARELTRAALAYLGMAVAIQVIGFGATYLSENVAWTATNALRRDLTAHCLGLDLSFHKAHTPGELIERIDGDVTTLAQFFSQMALRLASNGLLALGIVVLLFLEDERTGLVAVGYAGLIALSTRTVQRAAVEAWGKWRQVESELSGFLGERLVATEDIRANGGEPYVMARLYGLMRAVFHVWRRAALVQATSRALGAAAFVLAQAATLYVGIRSYLDGRMTVGTVYLLIHYLARLRGPLVDIRHQVDGLQRARASIGRILGLLGERSSLVETLRTALPDGALGVRFNGVTFHYNDGATDGLSRAADSLSRAADSLSRAAGDFGTIALEDVSFTLAPGKVLGLLGRTGSGKTTLTRLLFRLYDPTSGTIHLAGDVSLGDVSLSDLRRRIGLVTQEVQLFQASVRHNVTLFNDRVSDEQILDAFRVLGLEEWYRTLPEGLDTVLGAGGNSGPTTRGLSAGEAQLLALTRVFLKDPGIVVLDEASSRLDPATEQLLEQAINRLLEGRTAIVIAHRLATVGRADEIMVIEEGQVQEHGAREALARDPTSRFHQLLHTGLEEVLG